MFGSKKSVTAALAAVLVAAAPQVLAHTPYALLAPTADATQVADASTAARQAPDEARIAAERRAVRAWQAAKVERFERGGVGLKLKGESPLGLRPPK